MTTLTLGMTPRAIYQATGIRLRYLDNLVNLHCAPELLGLGLFPDIKEVTESFAAFSAMLHHLSPRGWKPGDASITGLFPGDGARPRTAATFAFRTAWQCISVDPRMGYSWCEGGHNADRVQRLTCYRSRVQDRPTKARRAVVVAVHSHADLRETVASIDATETAVIAIPCCVPLELDRPPDMAYRDEGVLSPQNEVRIWFSLDPAIGEEAAGDG